MAQVLAILNGLESEYSLNLSHDFVVKYWQQAEALKINGYYAKYDEKLQKYVIALHSKEWQRRVR